MMVADEDVDAVRGGRYPRVQGVVYMLNSLLMYALIISFRPGAVWKTRAQHMNDLLILILLNLLLYAWVVIRHRLRMRPTQQLCICCGEMCGCVGFAAMGHLPFLRNDLARWNSNMASAVVYSGGAALVLAALLYHARRMQQQHRLRYTSELLALGCAIVAAYGAAACCGEGGTYTHVHLHHYALAACLGLFFHLPLRLSLLAHGVCAGIMVEGIATYGAAHIFITSAST